MREILSGAVMAVSTRYDCARKRNVTDLELDVDQVEDRIFLEGDRFAGKSDLVGKPIRITLEVDE